VRIRIAGLEIPLHDVDEVLADLEAVYVEFDARSTEYVRVPSNPHLCFAGCCQCCREGAFFAVTLAEALRWSLAVANLTEASAIRVRAEADRLLALQKDVFRRVMPLPVHDREPPTAPAGSVRSSAGSGWPADHPGERDEEPFSARVANVARTGPACPLLEDDRCSVYANRPFLCRAYGFPADAFAIEDAASITFRSLCRLYAAIELQDYVVARDLRGQLDTLSARLAGGRDLGRFTSAEAILAEVIGM
jgi:Fe-S-cluster containining protein